MNSDLLFQLFLRLLPSIVLVVLAFVAASEKNTRERWANLLYQAGSLRPEQRDDPKVQKGVRLPFFAVALIFLIWPFRYYTYATRTIEVTGESDLFSSAHKPKAAPKAAVTVAPTPTKNLAPPPPPAG